MFSKKVIEKFRFGCFKKVIEKFWFVCFKKVIENVGTCVFYYINFQKNKAKWQRPNIFLCFSEVNQNETFLSPFWKPQTNWHLGKLAKLKIFYHLFDNLAMFQNRWTGLYLIVLLQILDLIHSSILCWPWLDLNLCLIWI